jgi:hypothetical protein
MKNYTQKENFERQIGMTSGYEIEKDEIEQLKQL